MIDAGKTTYSRVGNNNEFAWRAFGRLGRLMVNNV